MHLLEYSNKTHAELRNHPIEIRAACLIVNSNNLNLEKLNWIEAFGGNCIHERTDECVT